METLLIVLLVMSVVGYVASLFMAASIARSTGQNLFSGFFRKLLMVVGGIGIMGFLSVGEVDGALPIALIMSIGGLALLFLLNKKKEVPVGKVIILSVFETLSGFVMVLVFAFSIILKMINGGAMNSFDFDARITAAAREYNEKLKAEQESRTYEEEVYGIDEI